MNESDILLITLDAVGPDRLKLFGGPVEMPNLERLALRGLVCENGWSTSIACSSLR